MKLVQSSISLFTFFQEGTVIIESCNLIGSSHGPDFPTCISGHGNTLIAFGLDLKPPFF